MSRIALRRSRRARSHRLLQQDRPCIEPFLHLHDRDPGLAVAGEQRVLDRAAPRQRGSNEACTLRQPSRGAARMHEAKSNHRQRRPPHRRRCENVAAPLVSQVERADHGVPVLEPSSCTSEGCGRWPRPARARRLGVDARICARSTALRDVRGKRRRAHKDESSASLGAGGHRSITAEAALRQGRNRLRFALASLPGSFPLHQRDGGRQKDTIEVLDLVLQAGREAPRRASRGSLLVVR